MNLANSLALPLVAFTLSAGFFKSTKIFYILFAAYLIALLGTGLLTPLSLAMLILPLGLVLHYKNKGRFANIALIASIIIMIAVGLKLLPGVDKVTVMGPMILSKATLPWTWDFSFYKGVLGVGLAAILFCKNPITLKSLAFSSGLAALVVLSAFASGYGFDPKFFQFTIPFLISNLIFSVVAEETFFRLCIQGPLSKKIDPRYALAITGLLFGLVHFAGGLHYMLLSTLAGFAFATVFYKYKNIVLSCYCHWLVNVLHFLLLAYPK